MKGRLHGLIVGGGGEQYITVAVRQDFRDTYDKLKDKEIRVEIKQWREPRSKDANAYFHVLVNKIAEAQNIGNDEVKRGLVLEYGALARDEDGKYLGAMLPEGADIEQFYPYARLRQKKVVEGRTYDCYMFFKRTHELDTKEMARLIDGTIYVARGLGIDTDTPEQIARYKEEWNP